MDCEDESCTKEVGVLRCKLSGDILVGLQSPGFVMCGTVQLVYLCTTKTTHLKNELTSECSEHTHTGISIPLGVKPAVPDT